MSQFQELLGDKLIAHDWSGHCHCHMIVVVFVTESTGLKRIKCRCFLPLYIWQQIYCYTT